MAIMKRSIMTLYSGAADMYSHRVRIVLAEKGVNVDVLYVDVNNPPEDLLTLNPYNSVPTLVDRDLVVYEANVIVEYLDERFPYPPLLPVYPVARAKSRLMIYRIENDWLSLIPKIKNGGTDSDAARKLLIEHFVTLEPVFAEMPYFLSEEFSLIDCCLAPLLWRLPSLGITLPSDAKAVSAYAKRVFERSSFQASLSEIEREMRD